MRTLVITPWCTGEQSLAEDAPGSEETAELHHRLVMEGVRAVWGQWGRRVLEVAVFSADSGLLRTEAVDLGRGVGSRRFGDHTPSGHATPRSVREEVAARAGTYDLVFHLLWGSPLASLNLPLDLPGSVQQILLTGLTDLDRLSPAPNLHPILAAGSAAARRWHVKSPHVCGFLFKRLCGQVAYHGPVVLEWLARRPQDTEKLFYKRGRWQPQWSLWPEGG